MHFVFFARCLEVRDAGGKGWTNMTTCEDVVCDTRVRTFAPHRHLPPGWAGSSFQDMYPVYPIC